MERLFEKYSNFLFRLEDIIKYGLFEEDVDEEEEEGEKTHLLLSPFITCTLAVQSIFS